MLRYFVSPEIWCITQEVEFMVHLLFDVTDPGSHTGCPDGVHTAGTGSVRDYGRLVNIVIYMYM